MAMSLREDIENQYKSSIKDKNSSLTNTLRLIKSAIKDKDIEARAKGNSDGILDQEILGLFQKKVENRILKLKKLEKACLNKKIVETIREHI